MNVVDIFAGAGGFSRGFELEGYKIVVAIDNFKPVAETYKTNFPETEVIVRDVKLVTGKEIERICGDVEVLIGSPPCEPFTSANVKRFPKPEDRLYIDKRGQLTLHFIRLVKELKPKIFIMENVPKILELKEALVREFRRRSMRVTCVMSLDARNIIHPNLLEWASGNLVITELSGKAEHVNLGGGDKIGGMSLLLICPATANTISKIANGINDTPVTTFASMAMGSNIPMIIVPAMHSSLYRNPILGENIEKLKGIGVEFLGPVMDEGKAKICSNNDIIKSVIERLK